MVAIMIGIEILKPVKVSLFQDTQKLKKVSQKESLKDYRKDVSNNAAARAQRNPNRWEPNERRGWGRATLSN